MKNILIADDDLRYSDSLRKVFEHEGYGVECAKNVESALEVLLIRPFDLIFCDYRMPGKTGLDLLEELKRKRSRVPVVMISACADAIIENRALALGALGLMRKPAKRRDLIERAARVLGV